MATFKIGDVVRTLKGSAARVVTGISPATPPGQFDTAMARFEAGRGIKPRDFDLIYTRALRGGKPFGPEVSKRADKLRPCTEGGA
ncbi:hypothetical protein [Labedaea rhizosphaerae]|uniref:Uncharacterized protein n=1 Tax=Labedaea rhizosphaerae TaxID=598644 RepID=A0A4R6SDE2_LABRH|nr:hypothetical protein [Labedaea rhizosphaerae]TDP97677.1 hypothetical protein EV186_103641 [Labedaea rhizosphaerae]